MSTDTGTYLLLVGLTNRPGFLPFTKAFGRTKVDQDPDESVFAWRPDFGSALR
jgi:hypothetical protein